MQPQQGLLRPRPQAKLSQTHAIKVSGDEGTERNRCMNPPLLLHLLRHQLWTSQVRPIPGRLARLCRGGTHWKPYHPRWPQRLSQLPGRVEQIQRHGRVEQIQHHGRVEQTQRHGRAGQTQRHGRARLTQHRGRAGQILKPRTGLGITQKKMCSSKNICFQQQK